MSKRVLYVAIVVFVLIVGIFVVRPMLTRKPSAPSARKAGKAGETDTSLAATKAKGRTRTPRARAGAKRGEEEAKPTAAEPKPAPEKVEPPALAQDTVALEWHDDPFVRDWLLAGELRDMRLRAVTIGAKPLALINDRIVALGDTVSGKRVAAITRDSVVFEFGGQRRGLKIGE